MTLSVMTEEPIYEGTRTAVVLSLFNRMTKTVASGLLISLKALRPDDSELVAAPMAENPDEPGEYSGSFVPDVHGEWVVIATVPSPNEARFEKKIYVSPQAS